MSKRGQASHETTGVVRTVDVFSLVISRAGSAGEMTFTLNPATRREGTIDVGTPVSVRDRQNGNTHICGRAHGADSHGGSHGTARP